MSRLLSEKRIITIDTTSTNANTFDDGACVIDAANGAVYVSDGTNWSEVQLGGGDVTYEALNASGDIDTNLANGGTASTVPSSQAVKTYVDDSVITPIPTSGGHEFAAARPLGYTRTGHEIGVIADNCDVMCGDILNANYMHTVYNYSNSTLRISSDSGNILFDISTKTQNLGSVDILGGQKMVFIKRVGENEVCVYRESL